MSSINGNNWHLTEDALHQIVSYYSFKGLDKQFDGGQ